MLAADQPGKISLPFADSGDKRVIPVPSQVSITPGAASYETGFPPKTMLPLSSGGIPPDGFDFNGVLYDITSIQRWQSAGGQFKYDAAFATAIGGYPLGARLLNTAGTDTWVNLVDSNSTNPDAGGAGWTSSTVNIFKFLTAAEIIDCLARTQTIDLTAKIQAAINTGLSLDFIDGDFRCDGKLLFNQSDVTYTGKNATLVFNGPNTTRLADVSGANNDFVGLKFDGNGLQPKVCLIYLMPNTTRPRFFYCETRNLIGTVKGNNITNHMYGHLISPYAVTEFLFYGCKWLDITKYNNGVVGGAAAIGEGFVGGVFIGMNDDLLAPVTAQPIPTSGTITDCVMDNIQTILAAGLSDANRLGFDDGDGIRFYGDAAGANQAIVTINNLYCKNVSKRGVKVSIVKGVIVNGLRVDNRGLPYFPVCVMKLESGTKAFDINGIAGAAPGWYQGIELNGGQDVVLDGLTVDYCQSGVYIDVVNDTVIKNVRVRHVNLANVSVEGFRNHSQAAVTSHTEFHFEDSRISCSGNNAAGILVEAANSGEGNFHVSNVQVYNGDVNIQGYGFKVSNLSIKITSNTYAGNTAGGALARFGPSPGGGSTAPAVVDGLIVDASGINTGYLSATRPWLLLFFSNSTTYSNIKLTVPEGLSVAYPHIDFTGNDSNIDGLTYFGPGGVQAGTTAVSLRWSIKNAVRQGNAACTVPFITVNAASQYYSFVNIDDFRPTTATSITSATATNGIAGNVQTRSSNGTPAVSGVAKTYNLNTF